MKKLTLMILLAFSAFAADKPATITDVEKAEYWQLMTRATAASLKVSNMKEQARKAIEQAESESAKVQTDVATAYQKLVDKLKAKGCVIEQLEADIKCAPEKKDK